MENEKKLKDEIKKALDSAVETKRGVVKNKLRRKNFYLIMNILLTAAFAIGFGKMLSKTSSAENWMWTFLSLFMLCCNVAFYFNSIREVKNARKSLEDAENHAPYAAKNGGE